MLQNVLDDVALVMNYYLIVWVMRLPRVDALHNILGNAVFDIVCPYFMDCARDDMSQRFILEPDEACPLHCIRNGIGKDGIIRLHARVVIPEQEMDVLAVDTSEMQSSRIP